MKLPLYQPDPATATRFLFFTGKGGVGKTSLSCATALALAEAGKRVLLVSTDPASNLDEVLETPLSGKATPVAGAPGLDALNINPVAAAEAYRERVIGPMRGLLPEAALRSMEEQLSGSCTVEIAAFDEFSGFIGNAAASQDYDHLVFDTAPTGHTLRLMSLAKAWDSFLDQNTSGTSCLGPLAGLEKQRAVYEATVETLADATATTLVLVSRPQSSALAEAARTSAELRQLGIANQRLVLNGVFHTKCPNDRIALAMESRAQTAMEAAKTFIDSLPSDEVPLRPINILGLAGLRALLEEDLRSPCTEEIAVFRAFAREVAGGTDRFVVLDTAPTGHTLLLLDASESYQRELERQARNTQPEAVVNLLARLRDPDFTKLLLVTLAEATPVHEAAALQEDLRRAGMEPFAWVVNQSLLDCGSCDPVLQRREQAEHPYLDEVVNVHASRVASIPWQPTEPTGATALAELALPRTLTTSV